MVCILNEMTYVKLMTRMTVIMVMMEVAEAVGMVEVMLETVVGMVVMSYAL